MIITELVVDGYGTFLAKYQGRLQVKRDKKVVTQAPLMHLEQVIIIGKSVAVSSSALMACAEKGIPVYLLDGRDKPYISMYSAGLTGTVKTRRAQLQAYDDERGVQLAVAMAQAKVKNQANLLRYLVKNHKADDPPLHQAVSLLALEVEEQLGNIARLAEANIQLTAMQNSLLGFEGNAAQRYWKGIGLAVKVGDEWPSRKTRGATDPVNSVLNYGYGILYGQVERALVLAGLDPYAGFIHADRPGKPSLVLDFIEEFRQPVVDRAIWAMLNQETPIKQDEQGLLVEETKKNLVERIFKRLDKPAPYEEQRVTLKTIIQRQARHLATFVRGERESYQGFVQRF
ncbi:CRISPR-associated endonuclease Cas1 [Anaerolineales bacterium HSG6]|nr:CRISPR-associated endonuclease Cas1 [Anaerolineales bacterium HSG6]